MSDPATTHLSLPFLLPAQAQKHVTHNEALQILDTLVQLSVLDRDLAEPPAGAAEGDRYIVPAGAAGEWAGWDGAVACFAGNGWLRIVPQSGWRTWVVDEGRLVFFDGTKWVGTSSTAQQDVSLFGLGTTADAAAPFAARLNAALWTAQETAEGGDGNLRLTLNKETTADVLSLLFQTGYAARAEIGLPGSDNLTLKVSPDGETWIDALVVDRATGRLRLAGIADAGDVVAGTVEAGPCTVGKLTVGVNADATADDIAMADDAAISAGAALRLVAGRDGAGNVEILRGRGDGTEGTDGLTSLARFDEGVPNPNSVVIRDAADARYVARGYGNVGCVSLLRQTGGTEYLAGNLRGGSGLRYVSIAATGGLADHGTPPGTWMCLSGSGADRATLWERIA